MNGGHGVNQSTAYRWMYSLGYKFCEQHKCFYADAHEQEDVVHYRVQIPLNSIKEMYGEQK
eukprot:269375-Ditylum_brightwellii.AAC.1